MSERRMRLLAASLVVLLVAGLPSGCAAPQGPASKPATNEIQSNTESRNDSITAAIGRAQAKVSELESVAAAADADVPGLGATAELQQIERQLTAASDQVGQARTEAVRNVSASVTAFIKKVDDAAAQAPTGSRKRMALTTLSSKLKDAQTSLAAAISESSETTPGRP